MRGNGEKPIAQELGPLSGSLTREELRAQLWVLVESHRIATKRPELRTRQHATGPVEQGQPEKTGLSTSNGSGWYHIRFPTQA
jgi:hypothetical protein